MTIAYLTEFSKGVMINSIFILIALSVNIFSFDRVIYFQDGNNNKDTLYFDVSWTLGWNVLDINTIVDSVFNDSDLNLIVEPFKGNNFATVFSNLK